MSNLPLSYLNFHAYLATTEAVVKASGFAGAFDLGDLHDCPYFNAKDGATSLPHSDLLKIPLTEKGVTGATPIRVACQTGYNTATAARTAGVKGVSEVAQAKYIPRLLLE